MHFALHKIEITSYISNIKIFTFILNRCSLYLFKLIRSLKIKNKDGSVVIISLHKIGDTVFTFPAIKSLFDYFQGKEIIIICNKNGAEIYKYFFPNCNIVVFPNEYFSFGNRLASSKARNTLKELNPEFIIDLTGCMTSSSLIYNSKARLIYGINKEIFKGVYDLFHNIRTEPELRDIYLDAVKSFIPDIDKYKSHYNNPTFNIKDKILIHPFAGWKSKEWGIRKFIALAIEIQKKHHVEFIVEKNSLSEEILNELDKLNINVIYTLNIEDLIREIETCSIMISNDTGCVYLAAVLGKATYTIYGPSNPAFTFPSEKHHGYIQKKIKCSPNKEKICFTNGGRDGCPSFECMHQLTVSEVFEDLDKFLCRVKLSENNRVH
jgi:ADP-heptose:LPS heptosyltransferase